MALLFTDGFDHYSTLTEKGWINNANTSINSSRGRISGGSLVQQYIYYDPNNSLGTFPSIQKLLTTNYSTLFCGFAFRITRFDPGYPIIYFYEAGSVNQMELRITSNGLIYMTRNGTQVGNTAAIGNILQTNIYYYLEFGTYIHDTAGWAEARINNQLVCSYYGSTGTNRTNANGDTRNAGTGTVNAIQLNNSYSVQGNYTSLVVDIDDLYLCDSTGSVNNDFLGDVRVMTLFPNGAGTFTQFTKAGTTPAATNYQSVNETPHNSNVAYVSGGTANLRDTYAYQDLPSNTASVKAVAASFVSERDDNGTRTAAPEVYQGGSEYVGASYSPTVGTYMVNQILFEANPATAAPWTPTEVNGSEFGLKVIT